MNWDKTKGFLRNNANLNVVKKPNCCGSSLPLTNDIFLNKSILQENISQANNFSLKQWLTVNNIGDNGNTSTSSSIIELTLAEAVDLIINETVVENQLYSITDPSWANWVLVKGSSSTSFGTSGLAEFWIVYYENIVEDVFGSIFLDVWVNETDRMAEGLPVYNIEDRVIWNQIYYDNKTGNNTNTTPNNDTTNWEAVAQSEANDYGKVVASVDYSVVLDYYFGTGIIKRTEPVGNNEIYFDLRYAFLNGFQNSVELFKYTRGIPHQRNCHAHEGVIDNRNARRASNFTYVWGAGQIHVTGKAPCNLVWVESAVANISGAGVTEINLYGAATVFNFSSSVRNDYIQASNQAKVNISGSATATGTYFTGDATWNITNNARLQIKDFQAATGLVITAGLDTDIQGYKIHAIQNMDLTGKVQSSVEATPEYSNLQCEIEIVNDTIDFNNPAYALCGEIWIKSEGGTGTDNLDSLSNDSYLPKYYKLIAFGLDKITLKTGGGAGSYNLIPAAGVSFLNPLDGFNGDYAECLKTGNGTPPNGGNVLGVNSETRVTNVYTF